MQGRSSVRRGKRRAARAMYKHLSIIILPFILGGACTNAERTPAAGPAAPADASLLTLLPGNPTVEDDLQVTTGTGGAVTYQWDRNGQIVEGQAGPILPRGTFQKGEKVSVTVQAGGRQATASVVIENSPPKVNSVPFSPQTIHRGVDISVSPMGFDADGDNISYTYLWTVNGNEYAEHGPVLPGAEFKKGDQVMLTVIPSDSDGEGEPFRSLPLVIPNAAPRMESLALLETKGNASIYRAAAKDPDGDALTFSLVSPPPGMTIDPRSGTITWTHSREAAGTHSVEVAAQDPEGLRTTQTYSLTLNMPEEVK